MLDVHAPEHRIGGARDFFTHLFTITCGLLIALGLENAAEALHHQHQRREAETNIRQELSSNRAILLAAASSVKEERDHMLSFLRLLESRSTGAEMPSGHIDLGFSEKNIPDAAWRTANGSGVLAYMDYEEAERFAAAYKQQEMLQTAEEQALEDYLEFAPILDIYQMDHPVDHPDPTPEQARDALPYVRRVVAHLNGMLALGRGTLDVYDEALK